MKKKRAAAPQTISDREVDAMQAAVAEVARPLEDALSAANHVFAVRLAPIARLDENLPLREPLPDVVRRMVDHPVRSVRPIKPASRWPQLFRGALLPMGSRHPGVDDAELDVLIHGLIEAISLHLGEIRIAVEVEIVPRDYYANLFADFVLISQSHAAVLSLAVTD
ncbi:hypothetical protein [Nocardia wallacei]|nr:hypothetical protein [Nocardia wallacei]